MNIIVRTASGRIVTRPDTTWERDSEDFYPPEFVDSLSYTPVLFARISKPGRSIAKKFASRYYDGINFGILLYPDNMIDGSEEGYACASCLDHTSFLPFPLYNKITLGEAGNEYVICKGGEEIFRCEAPTADLIEKAIEEATRYIYIRTGDLLAIELQERKPLLKKEKGSEEIGATYCENELYRFVVKI